MSKKILKKDHAAIKKIAQDFYIEKVIPKHYEMPRNERPAYLIFFWANGSELKHKPFDCGKKSKQFILKSQKNPDYKTIEIFGYTHMHNDRGPKPLPIPGHHFISIDEYDKRRAKEIRAAERKKKFKIWIKAEEKRERAELKAQVEAWIKEEAEEAKAKAEHAANADGGCKP